LELSIEKMIYGGDALARLPGDEHGPGKAVFVLFVLPGEKVEANLVEDKPGFARAALKEVRVPSRFRARSDCPYYMRCGGCHYQHTTYEQQVEIKASILKENLRRIAKLELATELHVHSSPPWNYRNRTRMRVQSQPFVLGYNRYGSHEIEAIEQCPISSPLINRAMAELWEMGRSGRVGSGIREIEFFANANDSQLLLEIYADRAADRDRLDAFAQELCAGIGEVAGAVVFPAPAQAGTRPRDTESQRRRGNSQLPSGVVTSCGATALQYETAGRTGMSAPQKYRVSAGSFFQTNRHLTDELVTLVTGNMFGRTALDLYAGVGLFAKVLSQNFEKIIAVELSPQSFADLDYNSPGNVKTVGAAVEEYLERAGRKADLIVVDPPRGGLGSKVTARVVRLRAPRLTYVSCDPATLARDLVPLLAAGYRVEQAHLVDLFPQTFHIEAIVQLAISG
jgi:23S rRNA (uracil1939-C5)-methyltransferase